MANKRRILDKKQYKNVNNRLFGKGGIGLIIPLILIILAAAISLILISFLPVYGAFDVIALIIGLTFSIIAIVFVILFFTAKGSKLRRNRPFIVNKETNDYVIVQQLQTDIMSDSEIAKAKANATKNHRIRFKEEVVKKQTDTNVSTVSTFSEFSFFVNQYFLQKGYKTDFGNELIGGVITNHLLFVRGKTDLNPLIDNLNSCFNSGKLVADASLHQNIVEDRALFDAINTARSFKDDLAFLIVKNLDPIDVFGYFEPIEELFTNPNRNPSIRANETVIKIPSNLYIVVTLDDYYDYFKIESDTLAYSTLINFNYEKVDAEDKAKPVELEGFNIKYALNSLKDNVYLDEILWKKIDSIEELFIKADNYHFENKILSKLESYISLFINNLDNQEDAVDFALSNLIIVPAIASCGKDKFTGENDLKIIFNSLFDESEMLRSKEIINQYFESSVSEDVNDDQ